ncbi:hypothetical protein [Pectobacterium punjabense]|uniref:hypothetical protein n=1 Tax=Pectobacterium punjabense TaxID=2108399 RepID=UPI002B2503CC|nr:hypothetical protein [Pectobacterium punjabense]
MRVTFCGKIPNEEDKNYNHLQLKRCNLKEKGFSFLMLKNKIKMMPKIALPAWLHTHANPHGKRVTVGLRSTL